MPVLTFAEKLNHQKFSNVMTYFGQNKIGTEFFCYIKCSRDGFERMKIDYINEASANPENYGEIIYRDSIKEPDEKARSFLKNWLESN